MAEQETTTVAAEELQDPEKEWEALDAGLKSRAMRTVHEEQQKLVVELGRQVMEKQTEIAIAIAKAKAAAELNREEEKQAIMQNELMPRRRELQDLQDRARMERELLDTYEKLGRGVI